jgi:hypothetical protein
MAKKGVFVGDNIYRLEEILKKLEEETSIKGYNRNKPTSIIDNDVQPISKSRYIIVDNFYFTDLEDHTYYISLTNDYITFDDKNPSIDELTPKKFIEYVKKICPKRVKSNSLLDILSKSEIFDGYIEIEDEIINGPFIKTVYGSYGGLQTELISKTSTKNIKDITNYSLKPIKL